MNRISICTVCMNRLFHVRETLPVNIQENIGFPNIEFVLLDYNSSDGLEEWVRANMMQYIKSGILKYYRTTEPVYFSMSHSKNMISKLASGDILCMMDGDNYAGVNYAGWINSVFVEKGDNSVVSAFTPEGLRYIDMGGKITFHRHLFSKVRGFDESFAGYGMDDKDLLVRLEKAGGIPVTIKNRAYMRFIGHSTVERLNNYYLLNNLESLYILSTDVQPPITALYIMKDNSFYEVVYKFNEKFRNDWQSTLGGWYVEKNGYRKGSFERLGEGLKIIGDEPVFYRYMDKQLVADAKDRKIVWRKMESPDDYYWRLTMAFSECHNRIKYNSNMESNATVNPDGWGRGTVYLNFDYTTPLYCGEYSQDPTVRTALSHQ